MTAFGAILRFGGSVLCVSGVLLLIDATLTIVWQEPVSALIATRNQTALDDQIKRDFALFAREAEASGASTPSDRGDLRVAARRFERSTQTGRAIGRISLPSLGAAM